MADGRGVAFVSTDIELAETSGLGVVASGLAAKLVASGSPVTVVLVGDRASAPADLPYDVITAVAQPDEHAPTPFLARSRAAAHAVSDVAATSDLALVEFQDFEGLGFWALAHRSELGLDRVRLGVRMHGSIGLIEDSVGVSQPELDHAREMERGAYAMADVVIIPSAEMAPIVVDYYGVDPDRIVIGPPPVPSTERADWHRAATPQFVCFGRLREVKGSHDFVSAAVQLLGAGHDMDFRLVGEDGWSVTASKPMAAWLQDLIPARYRHRFSFEDQVPRSELPKALATAWAVALPSRFESFCVAAHEARAAGLPIVIPDLAAFRAFFDESTGALVYDGTVDELASAMLDLATHPDLTEWMAGMPPPEVGDPVAVYAGDLPNVRHPRSQAGAASAAVPRVYAAVVEPVPNHTAARRAARGILRVLPRGWALAAVRVLPQGLKDRFRGFASWPEEEARRADEDRHRAIRSAIKAGRFPELETPEVTIVIPCYNQGHYLEGAIASVFEQTFDSWEIVVVDDGSDDEATRAVIDRLDYPRTRVVRQENRGLPAARNAGMVIARGNYLVPLDADDEIAPAFLERLYDALVGLGGAAFAHCWAQLFGDVNGTYVPRSFNSYQILMSNSVVGCVLLRKTAWEAVGGYDESMIHGNEDWDLWVRVVSAGWGQVTVPEPLFRYRKVGASMTADTEARFERAQKEIVEMHGELYELGRLRRLKAEWYPLVSILAGPESDLTTLRRQTVTDVELIPVGVPPHGLSGLGEARSWKLRPPQPDVEAAIASARGKYIVDWEGIDGADPEFLDEAADELEAEPKAWGAGPEEGPVLWRTWGMTDPAAPLSGYLVVAGVSAAGDQQLVPGIAPDGAPGGAIRQPPEEEGRIPDWTQSA
jgi:glycosyltransferase involved in cell wall biosynthesis/GT2 family glycosyltransferase